MSWARKRQCPQPPAKHRQPKACTEHWVWTSSPMDHLGDVEKTVLGLRPQACGLSPLKWEAWGGWKRSHG